MTEPKLRVLSLGAGVQSTTLALMAAHGEIDPMPDCAIFADTGDETAATYEHLRWLMSPNVLPFPVHIASNGRLSERLRAGDEQARVPFHVGHGGLSKRQCTTNFKLRPIRWKVREILGCPGREYIPPGTVEQWIGISRDEILRVKPSRVQFIINRHPLIEIGMTRRDCITWLNSHGYPLPPKSSCRYCPYQSNRQWAEMATTEFEQVCELDEWLREPEQIKRFHGELYVHRSRIPIRLVDFTKNHREQPDLFINECEGMCGV